MLNFMAIVYFAQIWKGILTNLILFSVMKNLVERLNQEIENRNTHKNDIHVLYEFSVMKNLG